MQLVLVSQRWVAGEGQHEVRECLDRRWGIFFRALDVLPVPLASALDVEACVEQLAPVGIVLTGGNDLSSVGGGALSRERDAFESRLIESARARQLPLIGVCRGMQLLAQHAGFSIEPCTGHVGTHHVFSQQLPSRYPALGQISSGNSFHGDSVRAPARTEFKVTLCAEDGGVEAIEHESFHNLGIMWHPERYPSPRQLDLELFRQVLLA
jgi:gamma-glutamyl-gamma-aminobutyrate hydrolase PuuD